MAQNPYIRWFDQLGMDDVASVGGKTASLGEMYRVLTPMGIEIPNGFAITSAAYRAMLDKAGAWQPLRALFNTVELDNTSLADIGEKARQIIYAAGIPDDIEKDIIAAFGQLQRQYGEQLTVAVRSSATAEDLPSASFAGQHDTYLNVGGGADLIEACRHCFASLFTERAISYRIRNGFDHFKVALTIAVMKMVRADLGASGVMFTLDTDSGFNDVVFITGTYGLGENIVQGAVDPDEFYVHKPTFAQGKRCVLSRHLGEKQLTMTYASNGSGIENIDTPASARSKFCISDGEALTLADYALKTEAHYSRQKGAPCPMDIEWAKDGVDGKLYLVQARPETVSSQKTRNVLVRYKLAAKASPIATGRAIGSGIASGVVRKISDASQLTHFQEGEILVAESTSPDWGPAMRRAAAMVTSRGGRTCHAAIVAREFGIPAVVGIGEDIHRLKDGQSITLSCAGGEVGKIYDGDIPFKIITTELETLAKPRTGMMINLGSPDQAFRLSALPCDGVGLARMEFIISEYIKAHPMALLYPQRVTNNEDKSRIQGLIANYDSGASFFIEKLSEGIGTIAAAFYPRPVIVRMSDFKTNEYAKLIGGENFEVSEENPMIGFRGASRYTHEAYAEGFALECAAVLRARNAMGLTNIKLMIPFCRRVEEGRKVLAAMADMGLKQGENDLAVYVMCEIPNNVIQIDAFSQLFDGISIGSNDLTQLVLGVDRDSDVVAFDFDERDPGVMTMIRMAIEGAHRNGIPVGICGQAPSDYPDVAEYLVKLGIDSISLNPDALLATIANVVEIEKELPQKN
ncbi:MAG: phosphoenolpyruvate synthase [Porticoccaceae bacterium]|nr:phosphoenolpyruvate synthase [Porticoccaceae bacterium]